MLGRRLVVPLVVVGSVAVGGVAGAVMGVPGFSGASTPTATQTQTTAPNGNRAGRAMHARGGPELEAAAKALGMTTDELVAKLKDGKTTIADVAKDKNVPLNDVIDAMVGADRQRIEDFVKNPLPQPPAGAPNFKGGFGKGGPGGRGAAFGVGGEIDSVAKILGVSSDDLKKALRDGKSIADIAKSKNVDVNTVIDKLVTDATKRVNDAVANGKLTKEQAAKITDSLKQHITAFVNGEAPKFGGFGGRHGGPPMGAPAGP
jgi:flagellar hook-basal body complex protein FliE